MFERARVVRLLGCMSRADTRDGARVWLNQAGSVLGLEPLSLRAHDHLWAERVRAIREEHHFVFDADPIFLDSAEVGGL